MKQLHPQSKRACLPEQTCTHQTLARAPSISHSPPKILIFLPGQLVAARRVFHSASAADRGIAASFAASLGTRSGQGTCLCKSESGRVLRPTTRSASSDSHAPQRISAVAPALHTRLASRLSICTAPFSSNRSEYPPPVISARFTGSIELLLARPPLGGLGQSASGSGYFIRP